MLTKLIESRSSYAVGSMIDWEALVQRLPITTPYEVQMILGILKYSNDEKYLKVFEVCFDDLHMRPVVANSWQVLAYHTRYQANPRYQPYLYRA